MDTQAQITLHTKKLGVLIKDARLTARKSIEECADAVGVSRGVFRRYETGRKAPSLPELEILALFLELPIDHFWGKEALSDDESPTKPFDLARLVQLRQRIIGAQLRQERLKANISMKALAETAGIPQSRLRAYEMGERSVPVPELEVLCSELGGSMENFFDQSGPVGQWMANQRALREFSNLPPELQEFVCLPINRPYLELARNLSEMSAEKLRSVAEGLLNITY